MSIIQNSLLHLSLNFITLIKNIMNNKILLLSLLITASFPLYSQFNQIGGGLSFSSGLDFNNSYTGNPGLFFKGKIKVDKRFYIVPAITVFNRFTKSDFTYSLTNYMFHIDMDGQYGLLKEDKIIIFIFGGLNATGIYSKYTENYSGIGPPVDDEFAMKPGLNLGAGLKLYVNKSYDGLIQAKYIAGPFSQFLISLGVIYHLDGNNRKGW
jgi:hypothetical protein